MPLIYMVIPVAIQVRKRVFLRRFILIMPSFYQDRLGTNIGTAALKKERREHVYVFLYRLLQSARWGPLSPRPSLRYVHYVQLLLLLLLLLLP
jgi:hypothetical protein